MSSSSFTPYTYIQCPCSDAPIIGHRTEADSPTGPDDDDADERTFDPRAPRSNYSLYPLEYLNYCEDCQQIRCPRCVAEEIVTYYCPNCLFEVPSSNLKSEGNRCTRSCFQCPICIGPLSVTSIETQPDPNLLAAPDGAPAPHSGPFILTCSYCQWSSTEIGIKFDKSNAIHAQLAKLNNGGTTRLTAKEQKERRKEAAQAQGGLAPSAVPAPTTTSQNENEPLDIETQFANLKHFYQHQLADTAPGASGLSALSDLGFSSPTSLSRIMSLYTNPSALHTQRSKSRLTTMREALTPSEGLQVASLDDSSAITHLQHHGLSSTPTLAQSQSQLPSLSSLPPHTTPFLSSLRPIPYLLRTKRSKRCPLCRHIISKPESKVSTTRFRIKLVASSYIPTISIRPLNPSLPNLPSTPSTPSLSPSTLLTPSLPSHHILTFSNPRFEPISITLATPPLTPGRFPSKVTILCPQFSISANTDVWDEALKNTSSSSQPQTRRRGGTIGEDGANAPEAGKIWERGRNWVSIVVEVVPARIPGEERGLEEDEDVLEIPVFVRVEWEGEGGGDELGGTGGKGGEGAREKRELAYWCVLGLGRVART